MSNRVAARRLAEQCPWTTGLRLSPGGEASLVTISSTGLMVRCEKRLVPGVPVAVTFAGTAMPAVVKSCVTRCEVAGIRANGAVH